MAMINKAMLASERLDLLRRRKQIKVRVITNKYPFTCPLVIVIQAI